MADQLYLSYRVRGFTPMNMLRHYEKMLRIFPYSRLSQAGTLLRVTAVSMAEPPLLENIFEPPLSLDMILETAKPALGSDCAVQLETYWDLWQYVDEWKLTPSRVTLACFGPDFEDIDADHIRVDFGIDSHYLPQPDLPNNLFMSQSNIKSLLRFVQDTDNQLAVESRRLWTESGDNFAERLQEALEQSAVQ